MFKKLVVYALVLALVGFLVFRFVYGGIARRYDLAELGKMPERSEVLDRGGVVIGRLHGENRKVVKLSEVSPHFIAALLAREDNRFYKHGGVDYMGVVRAAARNVKDRKVVQGASTITMQLSRNSYGIFSKTLHRKLVEVALAWRIESKFSKDEILEAYVNRIFYGTGLYGVEKASRAYFGKSAKALTLGEAAMLAGIIRGPNRFSPFRNYQGALAERDSVLARMVKVGRIDEATAALARKEAVRVIARGRDTLEESYALDAVRRDLNLILDDQDIEDGGFKIVTTLDARLQSAAEASLNKRLGEVESRGGYRHQTRAGYAASGGRKSEKAPAYLQGALVAIDNRSGGILSVVGGRDFKDSQFNRALLSKRQIGSTFKPFVYTAAFMNGIFPGTYISDNRIRPGELRSINSRWSPQNSDGKFLGSKPAATGLVRSRNTMTVRVGDIAGIDNVLGLARRAGFPEVEEPSPQVFIGNLGATLKTVTSAFSIFPNNGVRRRPFIIDRVIARDGTVIYQSGTIEYPVISPAVSIMVDRVLRDVMGPGGTGARARSMGFKSPAGGKTGTTNDYHDAWFAGYTDRVTCGVWVGLDRPARIINRGYGSTLALPVWVDVLGKAEALGYRVEVPRARPALVKAELCRTSAGLATSACRGQGLAYTETFPREFYPDGSCQLHRGRGRGAPPAVSKRPPKAEKRFFDRIRSWFR